MYTMVRNYLTFYIHLHNQYYMEAEIFLHKYIPPVALGTRNQHKQSSAWKYSAIEKQF